MIELITALWLGIQTSISPCPLATNIAAVSYVGRQIGKTGSVLFAGLLYTLGRTVTYIAVAAIISHGLQSIPGISQFLQKYITLVIGPFLILVGLLLLDVFRFSVNNNMSQNLRQRVDKMGVWGAGLLGILFALAFCPVSAGLFFGLLISTATSGTALLPSLLYGIGTALPVVVFTIILSFAAQHLGRIFNILTLIEKWIRKITAVLLLLIGIYLILKHNFGVYI